MFKRKFEESIGAPPVHTPSEDNETAQAHIAVPRAPSAHSQTTSHAKTPTHSEEDKRQTAQHISIISNDLTILGKDLEIISKGSVQVDGEIRGDIRGIDVTVGEKGRVIGKVTGEHVIVDGEVLGAIDGEEVVLRSHARVDGDINHQLLTIDIGAVFDGSSKRQKYAPAPVGQERAPKQMHKEQVPEYNPEIGLRAPERS